MSVGTSYTDSSTHGLVKDQSLTQSRNCLASPSIDTTTNPSMISSTSKRATLSKCSFSISSILGSDSSINHLENVDNTHDKLELLSARRSTELRNKEMVHFNNSHVANISGRDSPTACEQLQSTNSSSPSRSTDAVVFSLADIYSRFQVYAAATADSRVATSTLFNHWLPWYPGAMFHPMLAEYTSSKERNVVPLLLIYIFLTINLMCRM